MNVTGACHCQRIEFTADVDESDVVVCHCTDCQILSGSAFRVNTRAPHGSFQLTRGQPKTYVKIAESGDERLHGFYGDCGTPLYSMAPVAPVLILLRVGAIRERASLHPARQIWCRSKVGWLREVETLPSSTKQEALGQK